MPHAFETSPSARAKCRGCGAPIAKGELRFGERLPNPYGEGEMTLWFHPMCGMYKRPEPFLEALAERTEPLDEREQLEAAAKLGVAHERLPRVDGAERASSGRAACRECRESVEKGAWRLKLVFYEEGMFRPAGFLHPRCARAYFGETSDVLARARHFSPELGEEDVAEIGTQI